MWTFELPQVKSRGNRKYMTDLYKLQDPTKQYVQSKFKRQPQAAPGLDKRMNPGQIMGRPAIAAAAGLQAEKHL